MIVGLNKAALHVLDAMSGMSIYSDSELDVSDAATNHFICTHIEKSYDDPALRRAEFNESSGSRYHLSGYWNGSESFIDMTKHIAERLYEGIAASEDPESCDLIVCDCLIEEKSVIAILKCDNKIGYTHRIDNRNSIVESSIINHYAILPALSQRISECAFVTLNDMSVMYKGSRRKIDGEKMDLIADILLECVYDISPKESINAVSKIAKKVTSDNGSDMLETASRMKQYITDDVEEDFVEPGKIAEKVFEGRPAMRDEFMEKLEAAGVPERIEKNPYVTKKLSSNIKIVTDTGIEISFPAEFYRDSEHIEIINNDDGTLTVKINNIGEIISR